MNLKASIKYQLHDKKTAVMIFYLVIFCLTLLFVISNSSTGGINGLDFATVIFLFVVGLNSFKESFLMLLQNSISRKTFFIGSNIAMIAVCFIMSVIDKGIWLLYRDVLVKSTGLSFYSLHDQVYGALSANYSGTRLFFEGLLYNFCIYLAVAALGLFITAAYYRMNKALKITVSVGVPILFTIILPLLIRYFFEKIPQGLIDFIHSFYTMLTTNPYSAMLFAVAAYLLLNCFYWLLMRKAAVKN